MTTRRLEPFFYAVCLLSGISLFVNTFSSQYASPRFAESMLYPRIILVAWIIFATVALIQALLKQHPVQKGKNRRVIMAITGVLFLCLAMVPLGFIPTAFIFFCFYAYAFGLRRMKIALLASSGTTLVLWCLFEKILEMPLPGGFLF